MNQKQQTGIEKLATESPTARAVFRSFRHRQREWSHHSADRLLKFAIEHAADGEDPTYEGVIEMLKELDRLELGVYKIGRKGHKTRIEWYEDTSIKAIGEIAFSNEPASDLQTSEASEGEPVSQKSRTQLVNETVVILEAALDRLRKLQRLGFELDLESLLEAAE